MSSLQDTIRATDSQDVNELAYLSTNPDPCVRAYVAENRFTPPEVLMRLSDDHDAIVPVYLLRNPSLPPPIFLKILNTIKDPVVKREACFAAVKKYKLGEIALSQEELIAMIQTLDKKVDTLTLIETLENLHFLHEKHK